MGKKKGKSGNDDVLRGDVLEVLAALLERGERAAVVALVRELLSRNAKLEEKLRGLLEGKHKSETVSASQLKLMFELLEQQKPPQSAVADADKSLEQVAAANGGREEGQKPPKQPALRRPPPKGAPRIENPLPVPDAERPCPRCGAQRVCVKHEVTEVVDLIPAQVIVRLDTREVLACQECDGEVTRAPMGDKVVVGGAYGSRLVAHLIVGKFADGLPLYRQGEQLQRMGLSMPSSSMSDQIMWGTDLLAPLWHEEQERVLSSVVLHVDATGLPVQDKEGQGGLQVGTLWGFVGDESAIYLYASTGKKTGQLQGEVGPEDFLARRKGFVVADASNIFDASFSRAELIEVGCNMHARRYFVKALEAGDARAAPAIAAFRALYDIEDAVREADAQQRLAARQQRARPVYDELKKWSEGHSAKEPPASMLGRAVRYLLNHHVALTRYLDDGRLPIDNGVVERLHRRPAVGRRAYLFAGSHAAAKRAAIAYSLLATCSMLGINAEEYLADVLPRLARETLTPAERAEMRPAAWLRARGAKPLS